MKWKTIAFVAVLVVLAAVMFWPTDKADERAGSNELVMPETRPEASHAPHGGTEELPTIEKATVAVEAVPGEEGPVVELVPGEVTPVPGSPFALRLTDFFTHWNFDQGAINLSYDEVMPAAKVEVLRDGEVQYYAWAFSKVPFFRMNSHRGDEGDDAGQRMAFTLMSYEGLELPDGAHAGHDHAHGE